ncbi:MAG: hypothetical protein AAF251_13160 [Pseudomonadota bacterium]
MSILDGTLAQTSGAANSVLGLAKTVGMDAAEAEKAIMSLTHYHCRDGDTVANTARATGLETATLSSVVEQIGGADGLTTMAGTLSAGGNKLGQGSFLDGIFG